MGEEATCEGLGTGEELSAAVAEPARVAAEERALRRRRSTFGDVRSFTFCAAKWGEGNLGKRASPSR